MNKKKIDFCIGIFDNLSNMSLKKIKEDINNCEIYGIGVYTDEVVIKDFKTFPIHKLEKRMEIAKNIEGVNFVFPINTNNSEKIKEIVKQQTIEFCKKINFNIN